jgi:general secretion pathway protein A
MYIHHFGLSRPPFTISPDPQFLWLSDKHARAFETLKEGILERDGCVLLTGDIGTGKTMLIKRLVQLDDVAAIFVTISDPDLSALDFCNVLAAEFGMRRRFETRDDFVAALKHFLLQAFSSYRKVLVIIDEAQRLNPEVLKEAAGLSNQQMAGRKLLKFFFVGQLEFNRLLQREENAQVLQSIAARYDLEPLTESETLGYIEHRLKVAGRDTPLFTREAVSEVHRLSKGYPRLINIVCDHALLYGYGADLERIDLATVRECSRDLSVALDLEELPGKEELIAAVGNSVTARNEPRLPAERSWKQRALIGAALAAAAAAAGAFLLYR